MHVALILVPTPIGNLRDITLRALDVLRDAAVIAAEDTRVIRRVLSAHGISGKRLVSYREQNASRVTAGLLAQARHGDVVLVSDAGTPGISDPGRELIVAAREAGITVEVLPGPVAFVVAAVLSGFALEGLCFGGFLPRTRSKREAALRVALEGRGPTAFYESPHRLVATLQSLAAIAPETSIFVARELTKRFEQQIAGTASELLAELEQPVRGEIVLVVPPAKPH
ncbi:MAG: 16S rRNA (cytidine(1402)-2'-O)-methyltransferase [Candidatus Eremiobacteraeota bacterium]|nr:16S rRNA (cytidine(1402)-2'-O)-methyltransferase [Candidatus Eremiobacteraeota bacterium]